MDLKSNEPFWLIKNGIINSYPSLHEDIECDVLIIGGGITGSLLAHQAIEDGYDTVLLDKREIANGSSSATTSMLQYEIDIPLYQLIELIGKDNAVRSYQACSDSIDMLHKICIQIDSKAGFKKKDSLYFSAFKKDIQGLKLEFHARQEAGFDVEWLEPHEIENNFKLIHTHGGVLSKQGASIDAFRLVHELLDYNCKRGLKVFDKTEVKQVDERKGHNIAYLSTNAHIKAKKIVYCVGYESANLIKRKIVNLLSTFAIVSEVDWESHQKFQDILVWNTAKPYLYFRTTDDGRLLIGGEDEDFTDPQKRDKLITNKSKKLVNIFNKYFPDIPFNTDFQWAGTFGETKDGLPYIGENSEFKNSYFVLGFGGNGITFSVIGMEMFSYWMKKQKHPLQECFCFER